MSKAGSLPGIMGGTLPDWLEHIQQVHFRSIDLTLDRVSRVLQRLGLGQPAVPVIAVSGTNGKGSTVAMLESIYRAAGYTPGAYTSPHLQRFNERIRVDGEGVSDRVICDALARIETVRAAVPLTYFEFATLAALLIFAERQACPLLLEVGMGGRLDAVNSISADIAMVTSIGLDHQTWLGVDREAIGWEKAGIFRVGRPAICADPEPPDSITDFATQVDAKLLLLGHDFTLQKKQDGCWHWSTRHGGFALDFPAPQIPGSRQWQNVAAVLMAVSQMQGRLPVSSPDILAGMASVQLTGRLQILAACPQVLVDVAHNLQAVEVLEEYLLSHPVSGHTYAIYGALADKNVGVICQQLEACIDHWLIAGLAGERGRSAEQTANKIPGWFEKDKLQLFADVDSALAQARVLAGPADRIVAFGSFQVVGAIISRFESDSE